MNARTKHPQNAPGRYWIHCDDCLWHSLCAYYAPNNIRLNEDGEVPGYFVYKQPENEQEEKQCREALEACPIGAVYDDGDAAPA